MRAGDGQFLIAAPKENLKVLAAFSAFVFKYRHRLVSSGGFKYPLFDCMEKEDPPQSQGSARLKETHENVKADQRRSKEIKGDL
jgi:hypothetical protein